MRKQEEYVKMSGPDRPENDLDTWTGRGAG